MLSRKLLELASLSALIALAACATQTITGRAVQKDMILPVGAQQTEVKPKQKFIMAVPIENQTPDFPDIVFQQAETIVCVEFVVSEDGNVSSVQQIDAAPGCERIDSSASRAFMPKVKQAVESWTFFGAALCDYEISENECSMGAAKLTPLAIKLAYKFRFSQSDGQNSVTSGAIE